LINNNLHHGSDFDRIGGPKAQSDNHLKRHRGGGPLLLFFYEIKLPLPLTDPQSADYQWG
jgi:hypothetical protein